MNRILFASIAPLMWAIAGAALSRTKTSLSYAISILIASIIIMSFLAYTSKITIPKTDWKFLIITGITYGIGGIIFGNLVGGKADGNYWVAITAAMLPALSLIAGKLLGEQITLLQWLGLSICIGGILLMGKVIK